MLNVKRPVTPTDTFMKLFLLICSIDRIVKKNNILIHRSWIYRDGMMNLDTWLEYSHANWATFITSAKTLVRYINEYKEK